MSDLAVREVDGALSLIQRARENLAEARDVVDYRRIMASTKAAAGVARKAHAAAKEDDDARAAILLAIEAEEVCLQAEALAGRWLRETLERKERHTGHGDQRAASQVVRPLLTDLGVSWAESSRWQQIEQIPPDLVERYIEAVKRARRMWLSRQRLLRLWREQQADERRQQPIPIPEPGQPDIRCGDFAHALADVENVDAIITDPPYPKEFLPLYGKLSEFAAAKLKPSGVLAVMCGQSYLREYLEQLGSCLAYRWTGAYITQGPRTRMHEARVGTGWKPILLFERADAEGIPFLLDDLFDSPGNDKRFHHWGQSEQGMAALIERLSVPGALVVDPFVGGGTTAVVCRDLNRRFIGCDIDSAAVNATYERLDIR